MFHAECIVGVYFVLSIGSNELEPISNELVTISNTHHQPVPIFFFTKFCGISYLFTITYSSKIGHNLWALNPIKISQLYVFDFSATTKDKTTPAREILVDL